MAANGDAPEYGIEFVEHDERRAVFVVSDISPAFANAVRRAMLADVPTMAIDTVRIIENTSVMFDEMIGLRLGLIPLQSPPGEFEPGDSVSLSMDVSGPATAYSGDLVSGDPSVEVVDKNIPIIDLKEDQRLELEAEAILADGKDHVKHQGGVAIGYRHLQRVEVVGEFDEFEEAESHIVRGVIRHDGELVDASSFDNDLRNLYPDEQVTVEDVPNTFVFHVETDGSLSVDDLVIEAAASMGDRAQALEEAIEL